MSDAMTEKELAEIEARANAATVGPWDYCRGAHGQGCCCGGVHSIPADFPVSTTDTDSPEEGISSTLERKQNDALFIAQARPEVPALLG
jgi:hypothetical protein